MALLRMSGLGSICAALALVAGSGSGGVRPHCMAAEGMAAGQHAPVAIAAATLSAPVAVKHGTGPHPGHPMGGGPTCPCAGACLDGTPVMHAAEAPRLVASAPTTVEAASHHPTIPVFGDPTAYLRPLPNAPPLA